jgi:membrane protein DedA with SNARE-associated domain
VFGVTASAAVLGDNAGYLVGRYGGWPVLRRYGHVVRLDERRLKTARYVFARHGGPVVAGGRFVAVLRTTAAFLAGVNRMPWRQFLVWNLVGGLAWSATWTALAFMAGRQLGGGLGVMGWSTLGVAAAAVAGTTMWLRRRWSRLALAAEAAYPGPLR